MPTAHAAADPRELRAAARLAGGDLERAELLLAERGRELRARSEALARAARAGELDDAPWQGLLEAAEERGAEVGEAVKDRLDALADQAKDAADKRTEQRLRKEASRGGEASVPPRADRGARHRARAGRRLASRPCGGRRRRTRAGADGRPRARAARAMPTGSTLAGRAARRELVMDTRRRMTVNVSEELALEALSFRLEFLLSG